MFLEIIQNPVTWTILGILVKTFAPAWFPILGAGKKLVEELTEVHARNDVDNKKIISCAFLDDYKAAGNHLKKKLK